MVTFPKVPKRSRERERERERGIVFGLGVSERVSECTGHQITNSIIEIAAAAAAAESVPRFPEVGDERGCSRARVKLGARGPRRALALVRPPRNAPSAPMWPAPWSRFRPAGRRRRPASTTERRDPSISVCQTAGVRTSERSSGLSLDSFLKRSRTRSKSVLLHVRYPGELIPYFQVGLVLTQSL